MQKTSPKTPARPIPIRIRSRSQYNAIASPVRDQILQVVINQAAPSEANGGVSIREIAEQLGRKPASLYRHIEALVAAGLIRQTGASPSGGRDATLFSAPGDYVLLENPTSDAKGVEAMCRFIVRAAAHAGKEYAESSRRRQSDSSEASAAPDRAMVSMFGWLDEAQQRRLHRHLIEVSEIFAKARRRPGTKLLAATMFIRPVKLPDGTTGTENG